MGIVKTAGEYDRPQVIVVCWQCERLGVYSKKRFVRLVGAGTTLPDALRIVAGKGERPCERAGKEANNLHDRCKIQYHR